MDTLTSRNKINPNSFYDMIGGGGAVKQLVNTFYDIIENNLEGRSLLNLHIRGHGIAHARIEQFNFLSGFLGGPNLFAEKFGHSNIREIHQHINIEEQHKDAWLLCMEMAMDKLAYSTPLKQQLLTNFGIISTRLINS